MSFDWESKFSQWAKPPSNTEEQRCSSVISVIRNAIRRSAKLSNRSIEILVHGSYRNNTNVRQDSDVDIAIVCHDVFFYNLPEGFTEDDLNITPATYHYSTFKNEVGDALFSYLSHSAVSRGNKAFNIHENTYHVDADVAAFFDHRRYNSNGDYLSGVKLHPDKGGEVINWPEQHYSNGVSKNSATQRLYKRIVRIIKALCNEMSENRVAAASSIPGFLIECLVWNVPNNQFCGDSYINDTQRSLTFLFNNTMKDNDCNEWGEVSELIYLFRKSQKWSRSQAHAFLDAAWDYVGFK